jgi:uroporphyrinogen decarboxylase
MLKRIYSMVTDVDKKVFIHSCQNVDEQFNGLRVIRLNCFNPFQNQAVDKATLTPQYCGQLSFCGGAFDKDNALFRNG